jgi:hypothetical protein
MPQAVLAYLSRYTHRVAISNCRLIGGHVPDVGTGLLPTLRWREMDSN